MDYESLDGMAKAENAKKALEILNDPNLQEEL